MCFKCANNCCKTIGNNSLYQFSPAGNVIYIQGHLFAFSTDQNCFRTTKSLSESMHFNSYCIFVRKIEIMCVLQKCLTPWNKRKPQHMLTSMFISNKSRKTLTFDRSQQVVNIIVFKVSLCTYLLGEASLRLILQSPFWV